MGRLQCFAGLRLLHGGANALDAAALVVEVVGEGKALERLAPHRFHAGLLAGAGVDAAHLSHVI